VGLKLASPANYFGLEAKVERPKVHRCCSWLHVQAQPGRKRGSVVRKFKCCAPSLFGSGPKTSVEMGCPLVPENSAVALATMGTGSASPYLRDSRRGRRRLKPLTKVQMRGQSRMYRFIQRCSMQHHTKPRQNYRPVQHGRQDKGHDMQIADVHATHKQPSQIHFRCRRTSSTGRCGHAISTAPIAAHPKAQT
jgi:hypothetical protein